MSRVGSGTPADDAGIESGVVITAIDGTDVGSASDLTRVMAPYGPDDRCGSPGPTTPATRHRATIALESAPPA